MGGLFNIYEIFARIIKYLIQGIVIAIVASIMPKSKLDISEIGVLSLTAAATFAILDAFIPSIGDSAKAGVGLATGLHLMGF